MGFSLSQGPFTYNRFDLAEKAKPDYLDFDKDGNKKEPMKKALKEKGNKSGDCSCDDKEKKEEFTIWANNLIDEGYDLSEWTWDELHEYYLQEMPAGISSGKYGKSPISNSTQKAAGRGTVPTSLTSGKYGPNVSSPPSVKKEETVTKQDVIEYLVSEGYASNEVSAEVIFTHITDGFLENIEDQIMEGWKPLPREKMDRQAGKAYGKEQRAAAQGDAKEANKQMQRRNAMQMPQGRKSQLIRKNSPINKLSERD
jgi:hypothetical protein